MSEQAFRETKCGCHEHQSVDRLREIIKEQAGIIKEMGEAFDREAERVAILVAGLEKPAYHQVYCVSCGVAAGVSKTAGPVVCDKCSTA